jgi:hypothetical protein
MTASFSMNENVPPVASAIMCIAVASWSLPNPNVWIGADQSPVAPERTQEGERDERLVVAALAAPSSNHGVGVLAVGQEHDARDSVPVSTLIEHLGSCAETFNDVGATTFGEGLHGAH